MKPKARLIIALLLVTFGLPPGWFLYQKVEDSRCATQGQAAVEAFLREDEEGRFALLGSFTNMEGSGYHYPVWNIQGYKYLTHERTDYFTTGSVQFKVFVTEGQRTAPGQTTIGNPWIEGAGPGKPQPSPFQPLRIFVSHPNL